MRRSSATCSPCNSRSGRSFRSSPCSPAGPTTRCIGSGRSMVVRLPRRDRDCVTLEKERTWLPRLAPVVPLAVPVPLAEGLPAEGYPFEWSVYRWLEGDERGRRAHRRPEAGRGRSGRIRRRLATHRSDGRAGAGAAQRLPRRAAGEERQSDTLGNRRTRGGDRRRRRAGGLGNRSPSARLGAGTRLDPRRSRRPEPPRRGGAAERGDRLRMSRRGRPRVRRDGCLEALLRRCSRCLQSCARRRRGDMGTGSRMGALPGGDGAVVLHARDEPRARPGSEAVAGRSALRSRESVSPPATVPVMFTGIVRELGRVVSAETTAAGSRSSSRRRRPSAALAVGDSISIDGVCLTAETVDERPRLAPRGAGDARALDARRPRAGDRVNVEPALRAGEPLGGHYVQGHVDAVGRVQSVEAEGDGLRVFVEAPRRGPALLRREGLGRGRRRVAHGRGALGGRVRGRARAAHARGDDARDPRPGAAR